MKLSVVRIHGGLGNQLFCYAFARSLESTSGNKVYLDVASGFDADFFDRAFRLDRLNCTIRAATKQQLKGFLSITENRFLRKSTKLISRLFPAYKPKVQYEKRHLNFDPGFLNIKKNAYFSGYWQSYLYFEDIIDDLRLEMKPKPEIFMVDDNLMSSIKETNSVSIHIRYPHAIANGKISEKVKQTFNVLSGSYYLKAIEKISKEYSDLNFFVFSDNFDYAKELLNGLPRVTFVDNNYNDYVDLTLMSYCKHQIIANSTFSWWGAHLNNFEHKMVISPRRWYLMEDLNNNDLLPPTWLTI